MTLPTPHSSWTVDEFGVRPLGKPSRRKGPLSQYRQRISKRIARYGTTYAHVERKLKGEP